MDLVKGSYVHGKSGLVCVNVVDILREAERRGYDAGKIAEICKIRVNSLTKWRKDGRARGVYIKRLVDDLNRSVKTRVSASKESNSVTSILSSSAKALHHTVHTIRQIATAAYFEKETGHDVCYEQYAHLADTCRDVMAAVLGCEPSKLSCNIKYFEAASGKSKEDWKVWTLARSTTQSSRPRDFGPRCSQVVKYNSAFAALLGCSDARKDWGPSAHRCFTCNDLLKHEIYTDGTKNWNGWYRSTMVFPLIYEKWEDSKSISCEHILGFIVFDSPCAYVFTNVPCIYDYQDKPEEYLYELQKCEIYYFGRIIADTLAAMMFLTERIQEKYEATNAKEPLHLPIKDLPPKSRVKLQDRKEMKQAQYGEVGERKDQR